MVLCSFSADPGGGWGRKRKFIKAGLLFFPLLLLSGCGISLEDRVFPLSMGVEYENGHYQVVYGIPQLSEVTGQSKEGGESEKNRPWSMRE